MAIGPLFPNSGTPARLELAAYPPAGYPAADVRLPHIERVVKQSGAVRLASPVSAIETLP